MLAFRQDVLLEDFDRMFCSRILTGCFDRGVLFGFTMSCGVISAVIEFMVTARGVLFGFTLGLEPSDQSLRSNRMLRVWCFPDRLYRALCRTAEGVADHNVRARGHVGTESHRFGGLRTRPEPVGVRPKLHPCSAFVERGKRVHVDGDGNRAHVNQQRN
jgi:hypothetical protein